MHACYAEASGIDYAFSGFMQGRCLCWRASTGPGDSCKPQARTPSGQGPLEAVAAVTSACIGAGGIAEEQAGTWAAEASDMLLDTWVELLYEHSAGFAK